MFAKEDFAEIRKSLKDEKRNVVFTNGCFDIIHRGHVEYLNEAKSLGDFLVVGLNSDSSVKKLKGSGRPVVGEIDRAFVLSSLKPVDCVIIFGEETPYELIKFVRPDFLVKGGDWKKEDIVGSDIVEGYGGKVISLKFVDSYSSTGLINKIKTL
ncbi:MAG TPA: D-glycero-beta-D-manno-heptose 1-phosphate adenylyltransferase [Ignavibacteria bacterium]|nr:D-glycero-beta-D-manno-heptose 1-phosphate adenylyltransferase [Ignavibacteria bacterium]